MVADLDLTTQRVCDSAGRIPTNRWPVYSETVDGVIDAGDRGGMVTFEAERDILISELSARVIDSVTGAEVPAALSVEYCDTVILDDVRVDTDLGYCCERKPNFLVGVREGKRVRFLFHTYAPVGVNGAKLEVSVTGMQGTGCCG